ncbi:MAG: OadG family transporter subunit [Tropicimonas sp.]|uniref:OadG family transporter subunit n=1 Tax=Tropicimonas sp. TaxID=2067044 RepID=UPI003A86F12D
MFENLELIGTGFAVVMSVLASIWASCALIGRAFTRAEKPAEPAKAEPAPPSASVTSRVPPHHLAAICAAVADAFGPGYVVTRVAAPSHKVTDWPIEGRKDTFQGRRVRRDWGPTRPTLGGQTPDILRGQNQ